MINEKIREHIDSLAKDNGSDYIYFDNPSFDNSIVGITEDGCHIVYSYDMMVREFAKENNCDELEAIEFIDYNTFRVLPYCNPDTAPIIVVGREEFDEYREGLE